MLKVILTHKLSGLLTSIHETLARFVMIGGVFFLCVQCPDPMPHSTLHCFKFMHRWRWKCSCLTFEWHTGITIFHVRKVLFLAEIFPRNLQNVAVSVTCWKIEGSLKWETPDWQNFLQIQCFWKSRFYFGCEIWTSWFVKLLV